MTDLELRTFATIDTSELSREYMQEYILDLQNLAMTLLDGDDPKDIEI